MTQSTSSIWRSEDEFKDTEIGRIPKEWEMKTLYDVCSHIIDCSHAKKPNFIEKSDKIFLEVSNIGDNGRLDLSNVKYVSDEVYQDWTKRLTPSFKDIVITKTGRVGATAILPNKPHFCIGRNQVIFRSKINQIDPEFLLYFTLSKFFKEELRRLSLSGTILDSLHVKYVPEITLPLPPLPEQKAIAHILSTLDEKIELNKCINKTLEEIGKTIFKRWFVDFEFPDEEGKPYKSSGGEMEFNEELEKEIPKGWEVGKLGDIAIVNRSSINRDYQFNTIEYIDISSVTEGRLGETTMHDLKTAPSRAKRITSNGDTIWSCVRPNRKSYYFIQNPSPNLVVSTGFVVLSPLEVPPSFLYSWVTTNEFVGYLTNNADGSAYPAVKADHFEIADILVPSLKVLTQFENLVGPLFSIISQNEKNTSPLSAVRNSLLPKLILGKIRVNTEVC